MEMWPAIFRKHIIVKTSKAKFSTIPAIIVIIINIIMKGVNLEQNGESNTDDGMGDYKVTFF
jgi:hypothetical protein